MQDPDWDAARALFPVFRNWAHLNTATFGPMPHTAVRAMTEHFSARDESASTQFLSWFDRLDQIREKLARLIGAAADDIGFCPNAGTALSWLLHGIDWNSGDEILALDHEFPNNIYAPLLLDAKGVRFRPVPSPPGPFDADYFLDAVGPRTRLVILSSVNYSNGMRAPLAELAPELRRRGVLLCVDATQSVGALRYDVRTTPADFLVVHGYKWMLGPAGAGFFYAPSETREWLFPTVVSWRSHKGWREHEQLHHGRPELTGSAAMYEGGVQAFALLFALETSLDLILECGPAAIERRALQLARETREVLASYGARPLGTANRADASQIVTALTPGRDPAVLCKALQARRVAVSARQGTLRVSLHFFNNRQDLQRLSEGLAA
ncbi:MAG: aminotransferase class V-fold PLP-dependent enzyme [Bryobacterales bacterium]|nr:aminotransferase class V-fold PLP-dependent enzyme [Bryobacterales bacterium]